MYPHPTFTVIIWHVWCVPFLHHNQVKKPIEASCHLPFNHVLCALSKFSHFSNIYHPWNTLIHHRRKPHWWRKSIVSRGFGNQSCSAFYSSMRINLSECPPQVHPRSNLTEQTQCTVLLSLNHMVTILTCTKYRTWNLYMSVRSWCHYTHTCFQLLRRNVLLFNVWNELLCFELKHSRSDTFISSTSQKAMKSKRWKDAQHHWPSGKCKSEPLWDSTTLTQMTGIKKSYNKCHWECGESGTLVHCWWDWTTVQPLGKIVWHFLKMVHIELPCDPATTSKYIFKRNENMST